MLIVLWNPDPDLWDSKRCTEYRAGRVGVFLWKTASMGRKAI